MFLKSLTISKGKEVIRKIEFHDGLNLIVDETPSSNEKQTGNNVGKTTVLMLIDFCLGGNPKGIYTDPENKKEEHKVVKQFLIENKVLITLVLKDDLLVENAREIVIDRNFLGRKDQIRRINGVDQTESEFERTLTNLLFPGHFGKKPTYRQIISHNIRYKDLSITNTLKTLDSYTRDDEYETLYLFLLGCDFSQGDSKQELLAQIRVERTFKSRLEKEQTRSAYETALSLLNSEIESLNKRKLRFNLNEHFEEDLDNLNEVKFKVSLLGSDIGKLEIRRKLIEEAQRDLQSQASHVDYAQLRQIYEQAADRLKGVHKTFEELCVFHDRMLLEKVKFIARDLPRLKSEIRSKSESLKRLLHQQEDLNASIVHSEPFEELEKLIFELNQKYQKKGEFENMIRQMTEVDANLEDLNQRLNMIDDQLFNQAFEQKIKSQVNKFNRYFSAVSSELYAEKYALKVDPSTNRNGQRLYKFSAFNTNFSSGKKQGEISCFDIAYTLFADEEGFPCYHFLLNDKKELMHDNQLVKIARLVTEKRIQFVASILKDKLPAELNDEKYFVVKLSQLDKLFGIEKRAS
ncbi:MAG: DUF2326 domain-containing protein [Rugosibacter sp.]